MEKDQRVLFVEDADHWIPSHRLVAAVVERAISDLSPKLRSDGHVWAASNAVTAFELHREAKQWLLSPDDGPFTFIWCCDHLELDAERLVSLLNLSWENSVEEDFEQLHFPFLEGERGYALR